jgi:hypothetical protein
VGHPDFYWQKSGAVSVRKVRQKEVAYNYTFLGENLGYSEQEQNQRSVTPASKIAQYGPRDTLIARNAM